jgi:hypothetical protein
MRRESGAGQQCQLNCPIASRGNKTFIRAADTLIRNTSAYTNIFKTTNVALCRVIAARLIRHLSRIRGIYRPAPRFVRITHARDASALSSTSDTRTADACLCVYASEQ